MRFHAFLLLLASIYLSGCVVWRVKDNPELKGQVLSSTTKMPISGATASLDHFPKAHSVTDHFGYFDIPATYTWTVILLLPGDYWPLLDTTIQKNGFMSVTKQPREYRDKPIYLTPIKAQQDAAANP